MIKRKITENIIKYLDNNVIFDVAFSFFDFEYIYLDEGSLTLTSKKNHLFFIREFDTSSYISEKITQIGFNF